MYTTIAKVNVLKNVFENGSISSKVVLVVEKNGDYYLYEKLLLNNIKLHTYFTKLDKFFSENPDSVYKLIVEFTRKYQ